MACFLLRGPDGERWMEEHARYDRLPGEEIVPGMIRWDCGPLQSGSQGDEVANLIAELDNELGKRGLGEIIKYLAGPVAKVVGKQNCVMCEIRRVIANAFGKLIKKHGRLKATAKMIGLVMMSFVRSEEAVAKKLKEFLSD